MDRQTIEREFWQQKIKEYIADKNKWGNPTPEENQADAKQFLTEFVSKLKEMYGEARVETCYRTTSYRRKKYELCEIFIYPVAKEIDETCFLCIKHDFSPNRHMFYFRISNNFSWYSYSFLSANLEDLLNLVSKYCDEYSNNKAVLEKQLLEAEK